MRSCRQVAALAAQRGKASSSLAPRKRIHRRLPLVRWLLPWKRNRRALELLDDPTIDGAAGRECRMHLGDRVKHAVAVEVAVGHRGSVTGGERQQVNLPPAAVVPNVTGRRPRDVEL